MNRFAAIGLLADAAVGKRIVVISATGRERRAAFEQVADVAESVGAGVRRVRRANGLERIDMLSGGWLVFLGHGGRGYSADIVFLDGREAAERAGVDAELIVASSPAGEVVHA